MAVEIRNHRSFGGEFIPPFSKGESLAGASGWGFEIFLSGATRFLLFSQKKWGGNNN